MNIKLGEISNNKGLSKDIDPNYDKPEPKTKKIKSKYKCENCGSRNLVEEIDYDDYDKYNRTTSVNLRAICQDCDYDNYIENLSTTLNDGTVICND